MARRVLLLWWPFACAGVHWARCRLEPALRLQVRVGGEHGVAVHAEPVGRLRARRSPFCQGCRVEDAFVGAEVGRAERADDREQEIEHGATLLQIHSIVRSESPSAVG
jgi:hypothetical protein